MMRSALFVLLVALAFASSALGQTGMRESFLESREINPLEIFPAATEDVSGDLTSSVWWETPRSAAGLVVTCDLDVVTAGTALVMYLQIPRVDGTAVDFVATAATTATGAVSHKLVLWPVGTPASDLVNTSTYAGKKISVPGRWRIRFDGQDAVTDFSVTLCDAMYLR